MPDELRQIPPDEFARRLKLAASESDKRYAFFLGAGCSVSSGVPDAATLVASHWLPRLRDLKALGRTDIDAWVAEELPGYDARDPAASYGRVMEQLFLLPEERQQEIERLCDGRFPGFGYATLAALMARADGRFNVALTTNFDDLIADALYLFTESRPLVIQHESLAGFIRPTRTKPLVVKLHGDHRLAPQNTAAETAAVKAEIDEQVRALLHDRGLIFIGYGGNDAGIHQMAEKLPERALPFGVFWVSVREPRNALREWLESRQAIWVESPGFDEIMLIIRDAFDIPHPDKSRFDDAFDRYFQTWNGLSSRIASLPTAPPSLRDAARRTGESFGDWRAAYAAAKGAEGDPSQADGLYRRAIEEFPDEPLIFGAYATFLEEVVRNPEGADELYRRAVELGPGDPHHSLAYAKFLWKSLGKLDDAEHYFREVVNGHAGNANALASYAEFLKIARGDFEQARRYLDDARAIDGTIGGVRPLFAVDLDAASNDVRLSCGGEVTESADLILGETREIDVVLLPPGVEPHIGLLGFSFVLNFNPGVVSIQSASVDQLLAAAPGSSILNASDVVPSATGRFQCNAVDITAGAIEPEGSSEIGPGILARLTIRATGAGESQITLTDAAIIGLEGNAIAADVQAALVTVSP